MPKHYHLCIRFLLQHFNKALNELRLQNIFRSIMFVEYIDKFRRLNSECVQENLTIPPTYNLTRKISLCNLYASIRQSFISLGQQFFGNIPYSTLIYKRLDFLVHIYVYETYSWLFYIITKLMLIVHHNHSIS